MTETTPGNIPIELPTTFSASIDRAEEPDQTTIPLLATPYSAPIINHPDTEMAEPIPSPAPQPVSNTSTPAPQRTATPTRSTNGNLETSPMPTKAASHGAPARRYLNEKVTGVLLEGMKRLAAEQYEPEDPLRVLGEFLLQKSKDLEGA
ncbi:hypothetical protein MMC29_005326 [Sticta canariensis]|nr:hypothetical protein [Sticta canariensis]